MINFNNSYDRSDFTDFLENRFLPSDYTPCISPVSIGQSGIITEITNLGTVPSLDGLEILEVTHSSRSDARVTLSNEIFRYMKNNHITYALVAFVPACNPSVWRLSFIKMSPKLGENGKLDWEKSPSKRYSFLLGKDQHVKTPTQFLIDKGRVKNIDDLSDRFSIETLTKNFYGELYNWYLWASSEDMNIHYPNDSCDPSDDRAYLKEHIIRLITRLMFVWFIKQKGFVPNELFDEYALKNDILTNFEPDSYKQGIYYNAILQNLFFASLNKKITERKFATGAREYGIKTLFRDNDGRKNQTTWFKRSHDDIIKLFEPVPFLNGGLFECLDKIKEEIESETKETSRPKIMYLDGFSRDDTARKRAFIPNALFFAPEHEVILPQETKGKSVSGILNIFKKYNFTVEENTASDIDVALDPELLGKVFENLLAAYNPETGDSARKSSGSFYTPREVVDYMVDCSLNEYLKTTVGEDFETKPTETEQALKNIKIIDPACGSGAFPMGILNNIIARLNTINPQIDPYATKLQLIENCIYGVDIQPIAVQISKLRFFISLICEQKEKSTDPTDNYGIAQLPNLETKFVSANTLVGIEKPKERSFGDHNIEEIQSKLNRVRHNHFNAKSWKEKHECRDLDKDLRKELLQVLESNGFNTPELQKQAKQIAEWDPYNQNKTAEFFDSKWMFGLTDGFDIVIGNPPYVSLEKIKGEIKDYYTDTKKWQVKTGSIDLYCLFYEKGMKLLKNEGHLCYITSNKWLRSGYGEGLRKLFSTKYKPKLLLDMGGQVFKSATVDTNILLVQNSFDKSNKTWCWAKPKNVDPDNMSDLIEQTGTSMRFTEEPWVILSKIEQSIKEKIEKYGVPLKDWDIDINYGIKTGCNEAFIIDEAKRAELIQKDPKSAEIIRPILRGKDIKKYTYDFKNLYLIASHNGYGDIPRVNIEDYPAVKEWLDNGGIAYNGKEYKGYETIAKRADQGATPYNLRNCAYMDDFSKPKIIYPNMTKYLPFVFDNNGFITNQKCFIITGTNLEFLTAFFNSSLFKYCFKENFPELQGGTRELSKIFFDQIPVIKISDEINNRIRDIIDIIMSNLQHKEITQKLCIEIDNIIFNLYQLSDQEKAEIGYIEIK